MDTSAFDSAFANEILSYESQLVVAQRSLDSAQSNVSLLERKIAALKSALTKDEN